MKKDKIIIFLYVNIIFFLISSCSTIKEKRYISYKDNINKKDKEKELLLYKESYKKDKIRERLKTMSLVEKRGILTMVNIPGYELTEETKNFLNKNKIKGIILFKYNIKNENQLKKLINDLREKIDSNLLIAIDQEGGNISRIEWEATSKISPIYIASKKSEDLAYEVAYKRGKYLKYLGINIVLAPVVDLPENKDDFIFKRSFGTDKELVCKMVRATVKGYKDAGIICVLKHFPGHGKTKIDSHFTFPVINKDIEELKDNDLLPFIVGIEAGAEMIMIGHIINSFIDKESPASLSYEYVKLLNNLNFKGIIITDDLSMTGKINRGIGWGINIITGSRESIEKIMATIQPIDFFVEKVMRLIY